MRSAASGWVAGRCRWRSPARDQVRLRCAAGGDLFGEAGVAWTWLSSTARRWALKSSPSRGTLPCTTATVTAGPLGGRRRHGPSGQHDRGGGGQRRGGGSGRAAVPGCGGQQSAGQSDGEGDQGRPADGRQGQRRRVGLAERQPSPGKPPKGTRERRASWPTQVRRSAVASSSAVGRPAGSGRRRRRPRAAMKAACSPASSSHGGVADLQVGPAQQWDEQDEAGEGAEGGAGAGAAAVDRHRQEADSTGASHHRSWGGRASRIASPPPVAAAAASGVARVQRAGAGRICGAVAVTTVVTSSACPSEPVKLRRGSPRA